MSISFQVFHTLPLFILVNLVSSYNETYLIKTASCEILEIDPLKSPLLTIFEKLEPIRCSNSTLKPLSSVGYNNTRTLAYLFLYPHRFPDYLRVGGQLQCHYQYLSLSVIADDQLSGISSSEPYYIGNATKTVLDPEQKSIYVYCYESGSETISYRNTHLLFLPDSKIKSKIEDSHHSEIGSRNSHNSRANAADPRLGVIIILLDSVSMTSFYRAMPLAAEYLDKTGWFPLKGHHKVRLNTIPNMRVLFTGNSSQETRAFEDFHRNHYVTAYGEDGITEIFNYHANRSDFYTTATQAKLVKVLKPLYFKSCIICNGEFPVFDRLMDEVIDFSRNFRGERHLAFFMSIQHTHDDTSGPSLLEVPLLKYLKKFDRLGIRKDSIIFLIGDHGLRFGPQRMTVEGGREDSMPMLYVSLPQWFQERHPEMVEALKVNKHRLTSHYDTHLTLKHIIRLNGGNPSYETLSECPTCQSLLREIPANRTCEDAGIPINYCFCNVYKLASYNDHRDRLLRAAQLLIDYMNSQMKSYGKGKCTVIKDPQILYGWETDGVIITVFKTNLEYHVFEGANLRLLHLFAKKYEKTDHKEGNKSKRESVEWNISASPASELWSKGRSFRYMAFLD